MKQNNEEGVNLTRSNPATKVNNSVSIDLNVRTSQNLLNCLLKNTSIDINSQVQSKVEDHRRIWTTFSSINL